VNYFGCFSARGLNKKRVLIRVKQKYKKERKQTLLHPNFGPNTQNPMPFVS
jgi:hypothetical protein